MLGIEIVILCAVFFLLCIFATGTDSKNLQNYSSYPDEVQRRIREIPEYRDRFKEKSKVTAWIANFFLFFLLFLALGVFVRQEAFLPNFLALFLLGQALNTFDLLVIDLLWWRNTPRIRFSKIPQKCLYQDPQKHFAAFLRAFIMYFLIALIDGYLLTLF